MPTKSTLISVATLLGATALVGASATAASAGCSGAACATPVVVQPGFAPEFGPMTVRNMQPMGHLRSIDFQRAPNVSITRVHGMGPMAGLSDAPSGFTGGCHPTSTTYCRQEQGTPVAVQFAPQPAPLPAPAPVYSAPAPVYSTPAPVMSALPSEPRVVRIGGGYDPSKFTPRVYGDPTPVPGIAHVPTSIVDRDPVRAQAALSSGRAVPQPIADGTGVVPTPGMFRQQSYGVTLPGTYAPRTMNYGVTLPGTYAAAAPAPAPAYAMGGQQMRAPGLTNTQGLALAPTRPGPSFGQPGAPLLQQSGPMAGAYGSRVGADGTYWEKVSGPTAFGDTIATSVICKRKLPTQTVNPVVPVPVPVPTPVPAGCQTVKLPGQRYLDPERGRWFR